MIDLNDLAPGQRYKWTDVDGTVHDIYIVGQDLRTGKWIASCSEWCMEISELEKDDLENMTLIANHSNHKNGAPRWSPDGTMLDDKGNRSIFDDVDK